MFSKNKDTDRKILNYLSDKDLFNICLTDKYFNDLCNNDEIFWSDRFMSIFGKHAAQYKPQDRTWRNHYIKVVRDINFLNNGPVTERNGYFLNSYNWWFFKLIDWQLADGIKILSFPYEKYSLDTKRDILFGKNSTFNSYVANYEEGKSPEESGEIAQNIYWLSYLAGDKLKMSIHEDPAVEYTLDYFKGKDNGMWDYPKYFTPAKVIKIINDHFGRKLTLEEIERAADLEGDILEEMEPGVSTLKDLTLLINPTIQFIDPLAEEVEGKHREGFPVPPENLKVLMRFD